MLIWPDLLWKKDSIRLCKCENIQDESNFKQQDLQKSLTSFISLNSSRSGESFREIAIDNSEFQQSFFLFLLCNFFNLTEFAIAREEKTNDFHVQEVFRASPLQADWCIQWKMFSLKRLFFSSSSLVFFMNLHSKFLLIEWKYEVFAASAFAFNISLFSINTDYLP